jgi:hypothetical protein
MSIFNSADFLKTQIVLQQTYNSDIKSICFSLTNHPETSINFLNSLDDQSI